MDRGYLCMSARPVKGLFFLLVGVDIHIGGYMLTVFDLNVDEAEAKYLASRIKQTHISVSKVELVRIDARTFQFHVTFHLPSHVVPVVGPMFEGLVQSISTHYNKTMASYKEKIAQLERLIMEKENVDKEIP